MILSFSEGEEVGELRTKLLRAEIELSQRNEENAIVSRQLQEFEVTLAQLNAQYKEVNIELIQNIIINLQGIHYIMKNSIIYFHLQS